MCPTLVAFHAHPDDESVLTAGTMARAAADGHRVVLVLATDGGLGQPADATDEWELGSIRLGEASRSAEILGAARLCYLGYADSGPGAVPPPDSLGRTRFTRAPVDEAAWRLAAILLEEDADLLLSYDRAGGYGHPDHVRVHQVGARAAELAGTPRVLEATAPRTRLVRILARLTTLRGLPSGARPNPVAFSTRREITHRIPVRRYAIRKRASLRAHRSQTAPGCGADRVLALAARIPHPLYGVLFGREWFVDPNHRGRSHRTIFTRSGVRSCRAPGTRFLRTSSRAPGC